MRIDEYAFLKHNPAKDENWPGLMHFRPVTAESKISKDDVVIAVRRDAVFIFDQKSRSPDICYQASAMTLEDWEKAQRETKAGFFLDQYKRYTPNDCADEVSAYVPECCVKVDKIPERLLVPPEHYAIPPELRAETEVAKDPALEKPAPFDPIRFKQRLADLYSKANWQFAADSVNRLDVTLLSKPEKKLPIVDHQQRIAAPSVEDIENLQPWKPETDLLQRVKNQDPSVSEVRMWESKTLDILVGRKHDVFTVGLGGCTAVAVLSLHDDGTRSISLSHYPPDCAEQHLQVIKRSLTTASHSGPDVVQREVFIVTPDDLAGTKWEQKECIALVDGICTTLKSLIPDEPKILRYRGYQPSTAFILKVPEKGAVRYDGIHRGQCKF